jgi:hypothetical protein
MRGTLPQLVLLIFMVWFGVNGDVLFLQRPVFISILVRDFAKK